MDGREHMACTVSNFRGHAGATIQYHMRSSGAVLSPQCHVVGGKSEKSESPLANVLLVFNNLPFIVGFREALSGCIL